MNCTTLISALEAAGIKKYQFSTDNNNHLYNNDFAIVLDDTANGNLVNIRKKSATVGANPYPGETLVTTADYDSVHEMTFGGDYKMAKAFLDQLGLSLSKEQEEILMKIDRSNYTVKPATGDYHPFKVLTPEEYEALTEEEKAAYDKAKRENDLEKAAMSQGFAVHVTV
jgi:hypothetical protein